LLAVRVSLPATKLCNLLYSQKINCKSCSYTLIKLRMTFSFMRISLNSKELMENTLVFTIHSLDILIHMVIGKESKEE
jgi:hypothetical protein